MHTDEAVHACLLGEMFSGGAYAYNPTDFHGPSLYFLTKPFLKLFGVRILADMEAWQLRLVPAILWSLLIFILPLFKPGLGFAGVVAAAVMLSLAAPFVYFSTDFIHESLFLLATMFGLASGWRFLQGGEKRWAVACGVSVGFLIATKETFVLTAVAVGIAFVLSGEWKLVVIGKRRVLSGIGIAVAVALLLMAMFFTSFGAHPSGLWDFLTAGANFTSRAGGQGHEKPWWTYLEWFLAPTVRAVPYSGWIGAVLFVMGAVFTWGRPMVRFLVFFTGVIFAFYCAIPYKTPWLALSFLVPLVLVAGAGVDALWSRFPRGRLVYACVFLVFAGLLLRESWLLCVKFSIDPENPLAYAATSRDVTKVPDRVRVLLGDKATGEEVIQVVMADAWPLPWYLRKFPHVGYWTALPEKVDGAIVIASPEIATESLEGIPGYKFSGFYGLRPDVLALVFKREAQ